jgi:HPt (histidine-containing phosphotransfer) domain-containing protein
MSDNGQSPNNGSAQPELLDEDHLGRLYRSKPEALKRYVNVVCEELEKNARDLRRSYEDGNRQHLRDTVHAVANVSAMVALNLLKNEALLLEADLDNGVENGLDHSVEGLCQRIDQSCKALSDYIHSL